jgi:hypothetical protein
LRDLRRWVGQLEQAGSRALAVAVEVEMPDEGLECGGCEERMVLMGVDGCGGGSGDWQCGSEVVLVAVVAAAIVGSI